MRVRLNSLRRDHCEQVERALEVVDAAALHEADEHRLVALDVGGHAEHGPPVDRFGVLGGERLERSAAVRLLGHRVGVEAGLGDRVAQHVFVARASGPCRGGRANSARCASKNCSGNVSRTAMP